MITPLAPTIITLPAAMPITFGQSLTASALINGAASVPGSFRLCGQQRHAGRARATYCATVVFTPSNTNHAAVSTNVNVQVNKAAPDRQFVADGDADQLRQCRCRPPAWSAAAARRRATFAFNDPTVTLNVGTNFVMVVFTPDDSADYTTVNGSVTVAGSARRRGNHGPADGFAHHLRPEPGLLDLEWRQRDGGRELQPFNSSLIPPGAGSFSEVVVFTPTNTSYSVITTNVMVTVNKATATVVLSEHQPELRRHGQERHRQHHAGGVDCRVDLQRLRHPADQCRQLHGGSHRKRQQLHGHRHRHAPGGQDFRCSRWRRT